MGISRDSYYIIIILKFDCMRHIIRFSRVKIECLNTMMILEIFNLKMKFIKLKDKGKTFFKTKNAVFSTNFDVTII